MAEPGIASDVSRPRVFVSYSREDSSFAGRLALVLDDRGFETVIDREDVDAEETWKARVRPLIVSSDQVIVILTMNSIALDSVRWEAELAAGSGKKIVVVVPAPLEDGVALSPPLSSSPWFHFYQHPTRSDSGIHAGPALENALRADLAWRRQYTSLFLLAEKWKEQESSEELLLRGDALTAALSWRASIPRGQIMVLTVADFLDASEQGEARRVVPAGEFERRLMHLEERRAAAKEAALAARAKREEAPAAPARMLTPAQIADLPLAPVHTPRSVQPAPSSDEDSVPDDALPEKAAAKKASPKKDAARRKADGARGKGLVAPVLIALLMFGGAGAVVWQVIPQYMPRTAAAESPAAPAADVASLPVAANAIEAEVPEVAVAQTTEPASSKAPPRSAAPVQTAPVQAAPAPAAQAPEARQAAAADPAAAAKLSPEDADWRAARDVGNVAAFRTFMLKWPEGRRYNQALSAARQRIKTLSTKPESVAVLLTGPLTYRELPTFRDKGAAEGAAGQTVNFADRIASPKEGDWLVLERDGAWPFRFVSAREIEAAKR